MTDRPQEWQCGECGGWLSTGWSRHVHVKQIPVGLDEMIRRRRAGELLMTDADDPLADTGEITTYWRTGNEPMRDAPCLK